MLKGSNMHIKETKGIIIFGVIIVFISLFVEWMSFANSPTSLATFYYDVIFSIFGFGAFGILTGQGLTATSLPQLAILLTLFAIPIGLIARRGIIVSVGSLMWLYASAATLSPIFIGPLVALAGGMVMSSGETISASRKKTMIGSAIAFIIVPLIIACIFLYYPSVIYNSKVVFQTANWTDQITITNYSCYFGQTCPSAQYNVSGFYYINATAHNTTCWVTDIVNLSQTPSQSVMLNSPDAKSVINYMNNELLQSNCNSPIGYSIQHHYAVYNR
jgi:hypothetical protein